MLLVENQLSVFRNAKAIDLFVVVDQNFFPTLRHGLEDEGGRRAMRRSGFRQGLVC